MPINETVLEMHYHRPVMEFIRANLGLGPGEFNFYKYSTVRECFVGFDQAYVQTDYTPEQLFRLFRNRAMHNNYHINDFFLGFFLQYKAVSEMVNRSRHTPPGIRNRPFYRASLDTQRNIRTGHSQHELLFNLNQNNAGAFVYYACPMIFDQVSLYDQNPDLNTLRLADLETCPSIYADNDHHFIFFDAPNADPVWCSEEPVDGKAYSPRDFVEKLKEEIKREGSYKDQLELIDSLLNPFDKSESRLLDLVHDSLTFISFHSE